MTTLTTEMHDELTNVIPNTTYTAKTLGIVNYPNPILSLVCEEVTDFDDELKRLIVDMYYTMLVSEGAGLAAPQVGIPKRILVARLIDNEKFIPLVMINPTIMARSEKEIIQIDEGCLSMPNLFIGVKRYKTIDVLYQNEEGTPMRIQASDINAIILQHEIDHLDGKTMLDRVSPLKRMMAKRKLKK